MPCKLKPLTQISSKDFSNIAVKAVEGALRPLTEIYSKDVSNVVAKVVCSLFHIIKVLLCITLHFLARQLLKTVSNFPSVTGWLQEVKVEGSEKSVFEKFFKNVLFNVYFSNLCFFCF